MHAPSAQYGVVIGQSVLAAHSAHTPRALQTGVDAGHCELAVHATQTDVAASQCGVAPEQSVSAAHPGRHVSVVGSHTGAVVPQSEFARHATQTPGPTSHRGSFAGQSVFT
jgi:hypothetical protein